MPDGEYAVDAPGDTFLTESKVGPRASSVNPPEIAKDERQGIS